MASETDICNRALQKLGAKRITSLTQDVAAARACFQAYPIIRDGELRTRAWNFAIKRAILAANATTPIFGRKSAFPLPSDFLRLLDPDPEWLLNDVDWQIEGNQILSNDSGPLNVRYIWAVTDVQLMDPLFREAVSTHLALEICEEITQSNVKKAALKSDYKDAIDQARITNSFENVAAVPPEDIYLTLRN